MLLSYERHSSEGNAHRERENHVKKCWWRTIISLDGQTVNPMRWLVPVKGESRRWRLYPLGRPAIKPDQGSLNHSTTPSLLKCTLNEKYTSSRCLGRRSRDAVETSASPGQPEHSIDHYPAATHWSKHGGWTGKKTQRKEFCGPESTTTSAGLRGPACSTELAQDLHAVL